MSTAALGPLLAALPGAPEDAPAAGGLLLEGLLLRSGDPAAVRIITGGLLLEFSADDILAIVETQASHAGDQLVAVPVAVTLRQPARLLALSPAAIYLPLLDAQALPFAYATRRSIPPMQTAPRYRALENAFRQRHGLE